MSSAFTTNLPDYTDPSAADIISPLISTTLAFQEGLFDTREGLKRVNEARVNELLSRLVDTDEVSVSFCAFESYAKLLEISQNFD